MKGEENLEEKLLIAKLTDKINECKRKNKIVNTEFLNIYQKNIVQKELNRLKEKNYIFFGGYEDAHSEVLVIYPQKFDKEIVQANMKNIIKVIRIILPKELIGKYEHKNYLSAVMIQGLGRERIGDIIVHHDEAYIIVLKENAEYLKNSLQDLTRFKKSQINVVDFENIKIKPQEFEEFNIKVASNRVDAIVAEIAKTSRNKAEEYIDSKKVSINYQEESKYTRSIKENDVVVIRGKGKFIIENIGEKNQKGRLTISIKKYK